MELRKGRRLSRLIGIGALLTVAVSCGGGYEPGNMAERADQSRRHIATPFRTRK